jgi:hypothetical protein
LNIAYNSDIHNDTIFTTDTKAVRLWNFKDEEAGSNDAKINAGSIATDTKQFFTASNKTLDIWNMKVNYIWQYKQFFRMDPW